MPAISTEEARIVEVELAVLFQVFIIQSGTGVTVVVNGPFSTLVSVL